MAATPSAAQCLSPAAEQTIKQLFAAGTIQESLGSELTLTGVNLTGTKIELRAANASGEPCGIDLTLPEASTRAPDRRGQRFVFHVVPTDPRSADITKALLATADLIDRALPDAAFADCSGRPPDQTMWSPHRYSRFRALTSAVLQVGFLLAATVFAMRVVRSM